MATNGLYYRVVYSFEMVLIAIIQIKAFRLELMCAQEHQMMLIAFPVGYKFVTWAEFGLHAFNLLGCFLW